MPDTTAPERDAHYLWRAIELAGRGEGWTSPNPLVGAVIVRQDRTIGEGFHAALGEPHAERAALASCVEDPAGSTMYVSLEPCCHEGRTPPCTDAILESGIARVVVASDDPTPKASGRGLAVLRAGGVEVARANGAAAAAARWLNQPFRKQARTGRPLVVLKSAMTLDGKVATRTGDSRWISGEESRARVHRWRAGADSVAVGIGTALADDPLLTARTPAAPRQPRRVVFDSRARLPVQSRLVASVDEAPVIVVCGGDAPAAATRALEAAGVEVVRAPGESDSARIGSALEALGARQVQSLLLEGGPRLAGAFFDADEIDEARIFVAPILAGGGEAPGPVGGHGVAAVAAARPAVETQVEQLDADVLITARLKDW